MPIILAQRRLVRINHISKQDNVTGLTVLVIQYTEPEMTSLLLWTMTQRTSSRLHILLEHTNLQLTSIICLQ